MVEAIKGPTISEIPLVGKHIYLKLGLKCHDEPELGGHRKPKGWLIWPFRNPGTTKSDAFEVG
jgi:hypothetical protein